MFLFKKENIFPTFALQPDRVVEEIEFVIYFLCLFSYFGGLTILSKTFYFKDLGWVKIKGPRLKFKRVLKASG